MLRWFTRLRLRLRSLFRRDLVESELDEELRYHLEREMEQRLGRGLSVEEARLAARRAWVPSRSTWRNVATCAE